MAKIPKVKTPEQQAAAEYHKLCQYLVSNLTFNKYPNWPQEIKMADILVSRYPKTNFGEIFIPESERPDSLRYFMKFDCAEYFKNHKKEKNLNIAAPQQFEISETKFGEDKRMSNKPKNVFDFIKA